LAISAVSGEPLDEISASSLDAVSGDFGNSFSIEASRQCARRPRAPDSGW